MTAAAPDRVPGSRIWRYAAGSIGTGGFATLPGLVLLYFLTDTLAVSALWAGLIIGAVKVWDIIIDPVIGVLSDRDAARTRSRRRVMLIGGTALPLLFVLMFAVPAGIDPVAAGLWVFLAYVLAATAFSAFQIPFNALPAELTSRYDERTRVVTVRVVILTFAILLFGGVAPILRSLPADPHSGYLLMAVVSAVLLGAGMVVSAFAAPRLARAATGATVVGAYREALDVLRSSASLRVLLTSFLLQAVATGLMLAAVQYVATYVLQSEDAVTFAFLALVGPAIAVAPLWQWYAKRSSKRRAFVVASLVFALACVALAGMLVWPGAWVYAPIVLAGIGYAGMQSLPLAMLPDVIHDDARRRGSERGGAIGGVWTAGETVGFAVGGIMLSIALATTGYISSTAEVQVAQPEGAVVAIGLCFSVVPCVLALLSLVPLRRYALDRTTIDEKGA